MIHLDDRALDALLRQVPTMPWTKARDWYFKLRSGEAQVPPERFACALQLLHTKARYTDPALWHKQYAITCPDCHQSDYRTIGTRYHCRQCATSWTNDALPQCWTPLTRLFGRAA